MRIEDWTKLPPRSRLPRRLRRITSDFPVRFCLKFLLSTAKDLVQICAVAILLAGLCVAFQGTQASQTSQPAATSPDYLYGTWYSYPLGNPDTDPIRHEFRHNQATNKDEVVVMRICQGSYRAVIAKAT